MDDLGVVESVWIGYATDRSIRLNAASGGIVTGALVSLLEDGLIDGAVVNIPDLNSPPRGKSILAKTKEELMHSAKSIYCVTGIKRGLNIAKNDDNVGKLAVVGLPCHISDLRKAMQVDAVLAEKVVVCFGLMCGHNILPSATVEALRKSGIDINDVQEIRYRSHGWYPYFYSVTLKNSRVESFLYTDSNLQKMWNSVQYQPERCLKCSDFTAEHADIACCDAWLKKYKGNQDGFSIVLTHTKKGSLFIEGLIKRGTLNLEESDVSCIYESNQRQITYKYEKKHA